MSGLTEKKVEKRLYPRRKFFTKVIFEDEYGEGVFYLNSVDISMGGMFLESDVPLSEGSLLFVSFLLPQFKRPLRLTAEIVRIVELGENGISGVGIRWLGMGERVVERLKSFLTE